MTTATPRFELLDLMRGLAALIVVAYHYVGQQFLSGPGFIINFGYLAVDFFFVLSGAVLTKAYADSLRSRQLTWVAFITRRLSRLYPMVLIAGVAIALITRLPEVPEAGALADASHYMSALLLIPSITSNEAAAFPGNVPLWSLSAELLVNAAWAALLLSNFRHMRVLGQICLGVLVLVTLQKEALGIGWGYGWEEALGAWLRAAGGFTIGCWLAQAPRRLAVGWSTALLVLGCALVARTIVEKSLLRGIVDLFVLGSSALLVAQGLASPPLSAFGRRVGLTLGELSYPLYLTHGPASLLIVSLLSHGVNPWVACIGLSLALAHLANQCDTALRKIVAGALRHRLPQKT